MKLVILDPIYFHERHIERLKQFGGVLIYNDLPRNNKEILDRIKDSDVIITASVDLNGEVLKQCRRLKLICLACSGYDRIDIDSCDRLGIKVANVPFYATEAVAEHTFALLLAIMKRIKAGDERVHRGVFSRKGLIPMQLKGKVFGILGTGRIGCRVAKIANCFECNVIATTLHPSVERAEKIGVKYVDLETLLKESDIISIHVSLNPSTIDLLGFQEFSLMKKNPILINTSRGKVINHRALVQALSKEIIFGAGLDVLPYEPPLKHDPLLRFPNVVITPHNAFRTPEALEDRADTVVANIESFVEGKPKNVIYNLNQ